jgi:hypothetical protein
MLKLPRYYGIQDMFKVPIYLMKMWQKHASIVLLICQNKYYEWQCTSINMLKAQIVNAIVSYKKQQTILHHLSALQLKFSIF